MDGVIPSPSEVNWLATTIFSNFVVFLLEFWLDTRQIAALKERGHTIPEPLRGLVNPNFFQKNSDLVN